MNVAIDYKQTVVINGLRSCPLFAGLAASDLQRIASFTAVKRLGKGQSLFCEGTPVQGFYIIQTGAIKLRKLNQHGHEQVIRVFRAPESVGEDMLFSQGGYCADACATEPCQLLMVQRGPFLALLKDHPELSFRLLSCNAHNLSQLVQLLSDLTTKDVETRLGDWLLQHCADPVNDEPQAIQLPMTKRLLASELGVCGETLSRALTKLRQRNLLAVCGRTIILRCPSQLMK